MIRRRVDRGYKDEIKKRRNEKEQRRRDKSEVCGGGARISGRGEGDGEDESRDGSDAVGEACILSKDVAQGEAAEGE